LPWAAALSGLHEVGLGMLHCAGPCSERGKIQRGGSVVVAGPRGAERDLVAVPEKLLPTHPLAVDVSAVEAAQVAEEELTVSKLYDAVLLRHNLVEQLNRVVRVPSKAVRRAKVYRLRPLGGGEDQSCHQFERQPI
jgi:hypothetical protein